ncbi:MAG TPA: hypothetical protein VHE30_07040 [Polyangiaceae bacterium]|nr:hypothetical protein [Polyangiaceae bacterium]
MPIKLVGAKKEPPLNTSVSPADLAHLDSIKELLRLLNDQWAGGNALVIAVDRIKPLSARCRVRAQLKSPDRELRSTEQVLALIGNRGLEAELLTLLEDLTILKASLP